MGVWCVRGRYGGQWRAFGCDEGRTAGGEVGEEDLEPGLGKWLRFKTIMRKNSNLFLLKFLLINSKAKYVST